MVIPTREKTAYDGWFCAFATIDLEDQANEEAFELIQAAMESSYFDQYVVYYTGEYDAEKDETEDFGLTFNIATYADYNEMEEHGQIEDLFTAKGQQLVKYNKQTIKVSETANNTNEIGAKIVKVTVK